MDSCVWKKRYLYSVIWKSYVFNLEIIDRGPRAAQTINYQEESRLVYGTPS